VTHGSEVVGSADDVALPAPVRRQLVELAAEVVGRMPAEEVPAALRPIARFAPTKRARLGAVALSTALDGDEAFRAAVADVVAQGSPELVEAIARGTSTAASAPVDVAVVAYLTRPDGWREALAAAVDRWSAERHAVGGARAEADELRAEVARLRAELRGEQARQADAVEAAVADTAEELRVARRTLRSQTGKLRQAERDASVAREEAVAARAELEAARAEHQAELERQRDRVTNAERAAEGARRDVRAGRELDDARLWLLTETLVSAAQGIRRELSLAPTSLRPADTVDGADPGGVAAGSVRDVAELDRVLALPQLHVIVDGYNVTKTGYPELSLADQRSRLVGALAALGGRVGAEVTVVFDGAQRPPVQPPAPRGVRVLFSAAEEIADDVVRRLVAAEPAGRPVLVATSDQAVVRDVVRDGARAVASAVLLGRLG